MIKIKQFNNIYGIKELHGADNFGDVNVIYAPNGTAKSSILDMINAVNDGGDYSDVIGINDNPPSFIFNIDGKDYDEKTIGKINAICYSGVNNYDIKDEDNKLTELVASDYVKKQIANSRKIIDSEIAHAVGYLTTVFGKDFEKPKTIESLQLLSNSSENGDNLIINILDSIDFTSLKPYSSDVSYKDFCTLSNQSVLNAITDEVKEYSMEYFNIVNQSEPDELFDNNFTYDNLDAVYEAANKNNYFDSDKKRDFGIGEERLGGPEIKNLLEEKRDKIYGSPEAKGRFDLIKKVLGRNPKTRSFQDLLNKEKYIVGELKDYNLLLKRMFVSLFDETQLKALALAKNNINIEKNKIKKVLSSTIKDNELTKIWNRYQSLFKFDKFELRIINKEDAYLGIKAPVIKRYYKGTDIEIINPRDLRFSTGEIRCYNFINLIIEIEAKLKTTNKFSVILDDAVESFDYKNKYGMVEYISSLSKKGNIQLIIFTHNFDFFRSIILAIGESNCQKYFGYRDSGDIVNFYEVSNRYYLQISSFNSWKDNPTNKQFLSLIPFARTILQLVKSGERPGSDAVFKKTLEYLHYDSNSETQTMLEIKTLLHDNVGVKINNTRLNFADNDLYLQKLQKECDDIVSTRISETDIEDKITLGLYLRLFLERFLYHKYKDATTLEPPVVNPLSRTKELIDLVKTNVALSQDEEEMIEGINVICPSYVHINSFMYEPLIDVGSEKLSEAYRIIKNANSTWPL